MPNENKLVAGANDMVAQGPRRTKTVTAATTLEAYETVAHVTAPASGSFIVKLPPVAEARGRGPYVIRCVGTAGSGTFDVRSQESGASLLYDSANMNADGHYLILLSDGYDWYELAANTL